MLARLGKLEGQMEGVLARLGLIEQDVRTLRADVTRDFRWTWSGMVVGFVGLAGMMAKGFGWIG